MNTSAGCATSCPAKVTSKRIRLADCRPYRKECASRREAEPVRPHRLYDNPLILLQEQEEGVPVTYVKVIGLTLRGSVAEPDHGRALGYGAGMLATLGETERAKEWIERGTLVDPTNTIQHFNFVGALVRLHEHEAALDLLASIIDKASTGLFVWLENDTELDPLRGSPRFIKLFERSKARFVS